MSVNLNNLNNEITTKRYTHDKAFRDNVDVILTLFTISIFAFFAIKPALSTIYTLRRKIREYDVLDQQLITKIDQLSDIRILHNRYKKELQLIDSMIPKTANEGHVLKDLSYIVVDNNIHIKRLTNTFVQSSPNYICTRLEMNGTFNSIIKMVNDINNLLRVMTVERIELLAIDDSKKENGTSTTTIQSKDTIISAVVYIRVYYE